MYFYSLIELGLMIVMIMIMMMMMMMMITITINQCMKFGQKGNLIFLFYILNINIKHFIVTRRTRIFHRLFFVHLKRLVFLI